MIALDTNLLVYAHRAGCAEHVDAQRAIERAAAESDGWCIPLPCLFEFWSVVTHPASTGGASPPHLASRFVEALIGAGRARVLAPGDRFAERCIEAAVRLGVHGPRVFDLQIGLLCLEAGVTELWTRDAGFVAFPGLKVRDPLTPRAASS